MRISLIFLMAFLYAGSVFAQQAVLAGIATVKDGDSILFGKVQVRLQGVAAPEYSSNRKEKWGEESRQNLVDIAWDKFIVCYLDGTTASSNRPVGICFFEGKDIGLSQVEGGFARDCRYFSKGRYENAEIAARTSFDLSEIYELPNYCSK